MHFPLLFLFVFTFDNFLTDDAGHWGFACLGESTPAGYDIKHDLRYLRYVVTRLGEFSHVWWSMANEFDYIPCKHTSQWVTLFNELRNFDSHGHLASILNGPDRVAPFERSNHPAISHHSVQLSPSWGRSRRVEYTRSLLQGAFGGSQKPVVWDECQYEGDLPRDWAKLSSAAMSTRFWDGFMLGVYVGHSEALLGGAQWQDGEPVLWWSKGGVLRGGSPPIIGHFKQVLVQQCSDGYLRSFHIILLAIKSVEIFVTLLFTVGGGWAAPDRQFAGAHWERGDRQNCILA